MKIHDFAECVILKVQKIKYDYTPQNVKGVSHTFKDSALIGSRFVMSGI